MRATTFSLRRTVVGQPATPYDARARNLRLGAIAALVGFPCYWHVRATGGWSAEAWALLASIVLGCVSFGRLAAWLTRGIVPASPGLAYEALVGFFIGNTLLFALTLASPSGIGWNLAMLGLLATIGAAVMHRRADHGPRHARDTEGASLVAILLSGLFATLWTVDQQPVAAFSAGQAVFKVWSDVFIHVREISAFAQSHGLRSLSDIKLAGVPAPVYHFASYMVPAALNALTGTSAMDAYVAFQLPFGLLLTGLAAYALAAIAFRITWPAVAAVLVVALPDAYLQGFGLRYLSYHFMSQVNLGMLYGIACIALAWLFMIEGCRRDRVAGVVLAYVALAACVGYKAHLFVANAALLLLYPCLFFDRFRRSWRVSAACVLAVVFVAAIAASQSSPRVPTLRLDGSGLAGYVDLLMGGFSKGRFRALFESLYDRNRHPAIVGVVLSAGLILLTSFGAWLVIAPASLWWQRRAIDRRVLAFVALVVVNYLVMSLGLALDERGVGAPEEFLNRPHAWAYFVVVVASLSSLAIGVSGVRVPSRKVAGSFVVLVCVLVGFVHLKAPNLQTFPEWDAHARYDDFNAIPACLYRAASYVREHARVGDLMEDSRFDEKLIVTSLAERQTFVSTAVFGGQAQVASERLAALGLALTARDEKGLDAWLRTHGVRWFVLHPEDSDRWRPGFVGRAVFDCDGYHVFRTDR